ncbi:hypothetical protein OQA88_1741, partial [Cercophora sp. LCS_1]
LLDQYKATQSLLVKHFDLIFIQHSVPRLESHERRALIPKALRGIGSDGTKSASGLFNVILRLLHDLKLPPRGSKEDVALREDIGLADPKDAEFVAHWLGKLILLRVQPGGAPSTPHGLSTNDITFLTLGKPETWNINAKGLALAETRIKAAAFLASGAFNDSERFLPAIHAASSTDFRMAAIGDDMIKRTSVSLEDKDLVKQLFDAHAKLPSPYRARILNLLSKSEISTTFTDEILAAFRQNIAPQPNSALQVDGAASSGPPGLELTKLHRALFEYINWVARIGPAKTDFSKIGSPIIDSMKKFVEEQGWPKPEKQTLDDIALRSRAYETIGVLAKGTKMSEEEYLTLAGWLFRSLSEDPTPDVVVNIDGALSSLTSVFKPPHSNSVNLKLRTILMTYMTMAEEGDVVRSARHAATKWANHCLSFSDVHARWIDILAVSGRRDERNDVVEEGQKGLDPWTYYANDAKSSALPSWSEMVQLFFQEQITHINSTTWLHGSGMEVDQKSAFVNFSGDSFFAFPLALDYCKRILFLTALKDFKIEPGWERQLESLMQTDLETRKAVRGFLASSSHTTAITNLLVAAFEGMIKENHKVSEQSATCFVNLASLAPRAVLDSLASRYTELMPLISSNKREIRALGAKAFGILAAHPSKFQGDSAKSTASVEQILQGFKTAIGPEDNLSEGQILACAHFASRVIYYGHASSESVATDLQQAFPALDAKDRFSTSVQEVFFDAYAQIWTAGIKVAPRGQDEVQKLESLTKAFVDPLTLQAKKGNEKAITALGRLALAYPEKNGEDSTPSELVLLILEKLYSLYEIKQAEVHFAVGEAIAAAVAGWDAGVVQLTLDVDASEGPWRIGCRAEKMTAVLEKLLTDAKTTKPSLLKASGIWLFCLIQHCSHLRIIQSRLRECQAAFMRLLSARDELVQETASRGLALVYEKGDPELKEQLVRDLVSAFTGTGPQLKVDDETELFEAGALPTGEGKSITSYKDIVNLANEVGDQSLVYKFMSLATNAATWSTRSAFGRFGLSNLLSESEIDPKLYPKLYRYRFDPNTNVQKSMNDIWKALVKDSSTVLETHFDAIMRDLLKSILGKEWRVREASCAAISDLIAGRPFLKYEPYYKDIWTAALKVLDDVKATVRNAALHLCISLSTTLTRQLEESGTTAAATAMMNEALPFLLSDKGMESGVEDVKVFSTITVIKIAKTGGKSLNPYIPMMVPHLLGLLSTIEPEAINYYYQRAGEERKEKIDKLRSSMVSQSPISEAIEDCLRTTDGEVMTKLAPGLEEAIKTAVGMPTKIGCSRVLTTLATRHGNDFRPHAARFLQLMEKQALDRNDEVSQNYARAAAYIIRVVPDEARQRFADRFLKLYLESENEARRQKVADAILALSKISPDHFNSLEGQLLPFAFLGKHDTDDYVQKEFEEVWSKHTGSSLAVARYIPEIVELVQKSLNTAQWALKHAGALAIASAVKSITGASDLTGQVNLENLKALWPVYDKSLALKTFPGKERLLDPFPAFVDKSKGWWEKDSAFGEQLRKIAIREAKRNNEEYRPHAFRCLWRFAEARDDLTMLPEIAKIVTSYIDLTSEDEDAMDVDKPAGNNKSRGLDPRSQIAWAAIEAVAKGYNRAKMQKSPFAELKEVALALEENANSKSGLNLTSPYISKFEFDAIRRGHWYDCVAELLETALKSEIKPAGDEGEILKWYLATLDLDRADMGTEDQRLARTKAAGAAVQLTKKSGESLAETLQTVKTAMDKALREERSLDVQAKWKECLNYLA